MWKQLTTQILSEVILRELSGVQPGKERNLGIQMTEQHVKTTLIRGLEEGE